MADIAVENSCTICDTDKSESDLEKLLDNLRCTMGNEKLQDVCSDHTSKLRDCIINLQNIANCNKSIEANTNLEEVFLILLLAHKSKRIVSKTANVIAEISKTDRGREKCTSKEVVRALTNLLKEENVDVLAQACRALGNICYENVSGNKLIADQGGAEIILTVLEKSVALKDTEGASFLREVATGLLLNFLVFYKEIHTNQSLLHKIITVVTNVLEAGASSNEAVMHALRIIEIINDFIVFDEKLQKLLFNILASNASFECWEICLEIMHDRVIKDEKVRLSLIKTGACELICKFVEKYGPYCNDEDKRSVLQFACNMILEYCSRDDSIKLLYDDDKGIVYHKLVEWLENAELLVQYTAVIAVNNFACNDEHCKRMVEQNLHQKVLRVLKKCNYASDSVKLQCGLLGILHRLAIHAENKPILLADGLFEILYTMLDNPNLLVIPYLLGTFRIAIGGQRESAISLAQKEGFIEQLVKWCDVDCPRTEAEASRLIAWLINNSRDKQIVLLVIRNGAMKPLVDMLLAQHPLMQNEALVSLKIITKVCLAESEVALINNDFGSKMRSFLEKSAKSLDAHIVLNALSVLQCVASGSDRLKEHLNQRELLEACKAVCPNENEDCAEDLKSQLANLMTMLGRRNVDCETIKE
ncbi:rap1 GTPase-GDP dissociation stimulator 1-B [Pseudomyrmex gracilis]|uniref:rap1 GTPase-GDP dissociation stimulator 1-B n=1 Tax=Pseudomyrmex gracilis TaxID=219809 RepID=UPI00099592D2|nr:rap1 GTPase-GDP dissociation stimulator 1-B [Pseudomyrmex gracilis]